MREILFRGQTRKKGQKVWMDGSPVDGQWVYGGVLQGIGDFSVIYGGKNANDPSEGLDKWCVYTDTLGQFTGLLDKNGTKIFEGDILAWDENEWGGKHRELVVWSYSLFSLREEDWREWCEVIGNIHDNPDLLKEEYQWLKTTSTSISR